MTDIAEQLELFKQESFVLRLNIDEAVRMFYENYWRHTVFGMRNPTHLNRIKTFFHGRYIDEISKADIERFRRFYTQMGLSQSTINKSHMTISRMFAKLREFKDGKFINGVDFRHITVPIINPASLVPKVKEDQFARRVYMSPEQKKLLCSLCPDEDLYEILDSLYWTQLRPSDLFLITSENVDLKANTISGIQHKLITTNNPSGKPYKIAIPASRLEMIERRVKSAKPGSPIFSKVNMRSRWERLKKQAVTIDPSFAKIQMRDFRGAGTTFLLDHGIDSETVRKRAGWGDYRMLSVYDKRQDERQKEASEKLASV